MLSETEISSSYFDPRYLTTLCNFTKLSMKVLTICGFSDSLLKKSVATRRNHIATSSINSSSILRDLSIILQFWIIDILTRERSLYPNHHQTLASWSYFYPLFSFITIDLLLTFYFFCMVILIQVIFFYPCFNTLSKPLYRLILPLSPLAHTLSVFSNTAS